MPQAFHKQPIARALLQLLCLSVILTMALVIPGIVLADEDQNNPWAQSIFFENDLFDGSDSNYTNGVKYSLISPDLSPHAKKGLIPREILELIHKLPYLRDSGPEYSHQAEFSFGQNMYTPSDISRSDLIKDDRPYAGWSYVGLAYHRKTKFVDNLDFLDSVEVQLGIVGPQAYAQEAQDLVHDLRGIDKAEGWDHQLKNEPGLVVAFERKWLFYPKNPSLLTADAIMHAGGAVGNVSTYLNSGLEIRFGFNLPRSFGVSLIRPAGSTLFKPRKKPSLYIFGAVDGRYVMRDIFLDGNTFTDSHSVDKKDWVADLAAGVTLSYGNLMLTYTHVTRSKEFDGQDGSHDFGSMTLSFFYPLW